MTNLRTHRLPTLMKAHRREVVGSKQLSFPAMIGVVCLFCAAVVVTAPAQNVFFTTLVNFNGTDGSFPAANLIQASDGNLYGTTVEGGANNGGTVFKMSPAGQLATVYSFCSQPDCSDGGGPGGALVQAPDGDFYGTTEGGAGGTIFGTVFKITPNGTLTTLYNFCSEPNCADGASPYAGLTRGADGNFYGTTSEGGTYRYGTVFQITPAGVLTTLHSFCSPPNCADGGLPVAPLAQGTDGNFYGTTTFGGVGYNGYNGTVFRITPAGSLTTLHIFCNNSARQHSCADGYSPHAGLVQGTDGNFYGTTAGGGTSYGTVFKMTPGGALTTLRTFHGSDGWYPTGALVQASDGNFYGTTQEGGVYGHGNIFKITQEGSLSAVYSFCSRRNCADGSYPYAGLIQAGDGSFYGTTATGGAYDAGTIFRLACSTCRP